MSRRCWLTSSTSPARRCCPPAATARYLRGEFDFGWVGVVPVSVVPVAALFAGFVALLAAGNLLALLPAAVAARTPPATALRAE